jgi:hypothetical protein
VLELRVTQISYRPVARKVFAISPPHGAKVVRLANPPAGTTPHHHPESGSHQPVTGAANVAKHLSFTLVAPAHLVGLPRQSVALLDWGGTPAALVSYGQNLGGIAVMEQKAEPQRHPAGSSGRGSDQALTLPTVRISPGVSGQELDTAIGTVVQFTRGGVTYTVLGSVPPAAAERAARAL